MTSFGQPPTLHWYKPIPILEGGGGGQRVKLEEEKRCVIGGMQKLMIE